MPKIMTLPLALSYILTHGPNMFHANATFRTTLTSNGPYFPMLPCPRGPSMVASYFSLPSGVGSVRRPSEVLLSED
jgi:hypothetical protein